MKKGRKALSKLVSFPFRPHMVNTSVCAAKPSIKQLLHNLWTNLNAEVAFRNLACCKTAVGGEGWKEGWMDLSLVLRLILNTCIAPVP